MINIQQNLKAIIKERGLSYKEVAQKAGISSQTMSNWLNRNADMTFIQITQICESSGISLVDAVSYPKKYIPVDDINPACEECRRKDEIIENLTELLRIYKTEAKKTK